MITIVNVYFQRSTNSKTNLIFVLNTGLMNVHSKNAVETVL